MGNQLIDILSSIKPSEKQYNKYVYTIRKGILSSNDAEYCSMALRNKFIDTEVDTAINKKALRYFDEAESEFAKKNYNDAAKLYKRAIDAQPYFFKAGLYMGDCFYFVGDYVNAINSFKTAKEKFPNLLEPRKYLCDAYSKAKLHDKALTECIEAMAVYPDVGMSIKLEDAAYYENKKLDFTWTARKVFPNSVMLKEEGFNTYKEPEIVADETWSIYTSSCNKIKDFCDAKGIITKSNSLTKANYLEVFGWEEMLKNSQAPWLETARKMQNDGFLDCYVLVTCYHFDFYDQYLDFVTKNKARLMAYYKKYLVARK